MLVERTIHQGLRVLGDIYGVNEVLTGTLDVAGTITGALNIEIGTTAWIKGDTTIGVPAVDLTTLAVRGMISIPAGGFTTGIVMEKALDIDIGASTTFDINDDYFRYSNGTNTLVITASGGINALGQTGIGSSAEAAYKLWVEPDDAQIGIGSQNDQTYGPLEDGWAAPPKVAMRITRDVSKYGLNDYAGIQLYAKPTSPHTAQGIFGVYSDTPANHHTGVFMAAYSGKWMTIFKGSYFGDFHLQTEYDRDIDLHFSQMDTNGFPATAISRYIMGFDHSADSFKIETGDSFTASPAIEIFNDNSVKINVVAPERMIQVVGFYVDDDTNPGAYHNMLVLSQYSVIHRIEVFSAVAFDDPSVNTLEIGYNGDPDHFGKWTTRNLLGALTPSVYNVAHRLSVGRTVTAYLTETSGGPNGEVYIYIWYSEPSAEEYIG